MPRETDLLQNAKTNAVHPELQRRLMDLFANSQYLALRSVHVDVAGGFVVLRGNVPTYFLKQFAQAAVIEAVEGLRIANEIEVTSSANPDNSI